MSKFLTQLLYLSSNFGRSVLPLSYICIDWWFTFMLISLACHLIRAARLLSLEIIIQALTNPATTFLTARNLSLFYSVCVYLVMLDLCLAALRLPKCW
jgi:hypothetical protein